MQLWKISRIIMLPAMAGIVLSMVLSMLSMSGLGSSVPGFGILLNVLFYLVLLFPMYSGYRAARGRMGHHFSALAGALTYLLIVIVDNIAFLLAFKQSGELGLVLLFTAVSALLGLAGGMIARKNE